MADEPTTGTDENEATTDELTVEQTEDVLVEEVSIDGMCGVY